MSRKPITRLSLAITMSSPSNGLRLSRAVLHVARATNTNDTPSMDSERHGIGSSGFVG